MPRIPLGKRAHVSGHGPQTRTDHHTSTPHLVLGIIVTVLIVLVWVSNYSDSTKNYSSMDSKDDNNLDDNITDGEIRGDQSDGHEAQPETGPA